LHYLAEAESRELAQTAISAPEGGAG
jgi:hypothetical protein